jgi:hypothetical protein
MRQSPLLDDERHFEADRPSNPCSSSMRAVAFWFLVSAKLAGGPLWIKVGVVKARGMVALLVRPAEEDVGWDGCVESIDEERIGPAAGPVGTSSVPSASAVQPTSAPPPDAAPVCASVADDMDVSEKPSDRSTPGVRP